jgi:hypothetical protein
MDEVLREELLAKAAAKKYGAVIFLHCEKRLHRFSMSDAAVIGAIENGLNRLRHLHREFLCHFVVHDDVDRGPG